VTPLGTTRHDILMVADEHIPSANLLLRRMRRPALGVKLLRSRRDRIAGTSLSKARKGQQVWVRYQGPAEVVVRGD